jgi:citrate synthase
LGYNNKKEAFTVNDKNFYTISHPIHQTAHAKHMIKRFTTSAKIYSYVKKQESICIQNDAIAPELYEQYGVNRGLRDKNGNGVLTGLTSISKIISFKNEDGKKVPCDGELWYRGYNVKDIISSLKDDEYGFEKTAYLLLFGEMPTESALSEFREMIGESRTLPTNFTRDVIMKAPSADIMNSMTRSILTLASYDKNMSPTVSNNLRQCIQLISLFPVIAAYAYHAYNHYENDESMYIHRPDPSLSTAENLLMLLRPDKSYTPLEAKVLDTALILHMEHGGGNNSTFTTRVVTSSGSDTYSTIAAAMSSLKGPKHGGANIKVMEMMYNIKANVSDTSDEKQVGEYLSKILEGKAFDGKGLIYGMGHAVYSLSDPRERVFRGYVETLAKEKHREKDMQLYEHIERLAPEFIAKKRKIYKGVSPNVDFYSGFVYDMLGIPKELYTAIFAIARIVGWSAHRIEELVTADKIIRPAYLSVMKERE